MFFSSWDNLLRVLIVGCLAYVGLVTMLRISGKRTLTSLNIFDMVVTIAFGSTLASTILPSGAALSDGLLALAVLILLQYALAKLIVRSPKFSRVVKSEPALLLHKGSMLKKTMHKERIEEEEVLAAIRKKGGLDVAEIEAVILETDGMISVIQKSSGTVTVSSLQGTRPRSARDDLSGR